MTRVLVKTFGCKVNFSDSQALLEDLARAGYAAAEMDSAAIAPGEVGVTETHSQELIVIVNSCCVTAEAERKARQFIRRMRRRLPQGAVLCSGCATRHPRLREQYAEAGAVLLPTAGEVVAWLTAHHPPATAPGGPTADQAGTQSGRTRAFIKVQDGCCNHCSYCIVPQVRPFASRPLPEVLDEAAQRLAEGHRELVLTGINIGHYGLAPVATLQRPDGGVRYEAVPGQPGFYELVQSVLDHLPAGARLRLSSIEPEQFDPRLFELFADARLCPHLHLPLQSGSDAVLSAMRRRYTTAEYRELAGRFREVCPNGSLTTDILVGYPSETEQDFARTLARCTELGFERVHGFPFSARLGTQAAELTPHCQSEVTQRNRRLLAHCRTIADARWARMLGTEAQVLIEEQRGGWWTGHGEAYQIVRLPLKPDVAGVLSDIRGCIVPVRLAAYAAGEFGAEWTA